jgi:hypothetical protein
MKNARERERLCQEGKGLFSLSLSLYTLSLHDNVVFFVFFFLAASPA